jgi:hypothetical protein
MSSRTLILAAVLLLVGSFTAGRAFAQENLDAGKSASQLFAGTCTACHKSPRGLLKTVSPSSLPGFLRQHYTTSPNMAGALASYLISNGATDTRAGGDAPKGTKEGAKGAKEGAKEGSRQDARQEPTQEGRPVEQRDRWGRRVRPGAASQEATAPADEHKPEAETSAPAQAAGEHGSEGRSRKQKLTKRGKPGEALPKEEPAAAAEPKNELRNEPKNEPKGEPKNEAKTEPKGSETATREESKPALTKPAEENRSQSAKVEQPAEAPAVRPDPVPPVTPAAPGANAPAAEAPPPVAAPAQQPTASQPAPSQAAASPAPATEMAVPLPAAAVPPPAPPAVTASVPQPPVAPAGPPAPPISQ